MTRMFAVWLGWLVAPTRPRTGRERGLSQSTEVAILLGAAAAVAIVIMVFIKTYVSHRLGEVQNP